MLKNNLKGKIKNLYIADITRTDLCVDEENNAIGIWVNYKLPVINSEKEYYGYMLEESEHVLKMIEDIFSTWSNQYRKCVDKYLFDDMDNKYLKELVKNCLESDNEMWFVEEEDMPSKEVLDKLISDIDRYDLSEYIEINTSEEDESDSEIIVYGGIITQFLF